MPFNHSTNRDDARTSIVHFTDHQHRVWEVSTRNGNKARNTCHSALDSLPQFYVWPIEGSTGLLVDTVKSKKTPRKYSTACWSSSPVLYCARLPIRFAPWLDSLNLNLHTHTDADYSTKLGTLAHTSEIIIKYIHTIVEDDGDD